MIGMVALIFSCVPCIAYCAEAAPEDELMKASKNGDTVKVDRLLKHGANVNHTNRRGDTPLILAAVRGHIQIVNNLLRHGADVNYGNARVGTALTSAACYGHAQIVDELLYHGANVNPDGRSPLLFAVANRHTQIVNKLLEHGATVDAEHVFGETPLKEAARQGHMEIAGNLLRYGSDVNFVGKDGCSPLYCAVKMGEIGMVDLLLQNGANVNQAGNYMLSPLKIAITYKMKEIIERLQPLVRKQTEELCERMEDKRFPNELHVEIMKYVIDASSMDEVDVLTRKWLHKLTAEQMMLLYLFKADETAVRRRLKNPNPDAFQLDFIGLPLELQKAIIKKYAPLLHLSLKKKGMLIQQELTQ